MRESTGDAAHGPRPRGGHAAFTDTAGDIPTRDTVTATAGDIPTRDTVTATAGDIKKAAGQGSPPVGEVADYFAALAFGATTTIPVATI